MSKTAVYNTTVSWKGAHWGHMVMGNGPEMAFSAPPDAEGHAGVLTPEDAYVGGHQQLHYDDVYLGQRALQIGSAVI